MLRTLQVFECALSIESTSIWSLASLCLSDNLNHLKVSIKYRLDTIGQCLPTQKFCQKWNASTNELNVLCSHV